MTVDAPILSPIARNAAGVTVVTQFQTGHGWTLLSGTTGDLNATGVGHVAGTQCVWFRGNGNNTIVGCRRIGGTAYDLTGKDIGLLLRVDEPNQILGGSANFVLYVGNTSFANFITFDLAASSSIKYFPRRNTSGTDYGGSWVHFTIPTDPSGSNSYTAKTGAQTAAQILANVTDWQIYHRDPNGSTPAKISVQEVYLVPKQTTYPNGVCCLTFDDGYLSDLNKVAPMLAAVGGRATSYVIQDQIGFSGTFLSLSQLQQLQNQYGWDVCAHSAAGSSHAAGSGKGMNAMTADAAIADVQAERDWLKANSFRGYHHFAYPHGAYCVYADGTGNTNDRVDETLAPYARTARTLYSKTPETIPPADPTKLRTFLSTTSATTLASVKTAADVTKRVQGAMVVVFHQIVDSGVSLSTQWLTSDLQQLVDYVTSLGMPLLAVSEVFGTGIAPPNLYGSQAKIMGYQMSTAAGNRWADTLAVSLASGTITATTTGPAVELGDRGTLRLTLTITGSPAGSSPTLDVAVQTSMDGSTGWTAVAAFAQQNAAGVTRKVFAGCDRFIRIVETIGGTGGPSFDRTVVGEAV